MASEKIVTKNRWYGQPVLPPYGGLLLIMKTRKVKQASTKPKRVVRPGSKAKYGVKKALGQSVGAKPQVGIPPPIRMFQVNRRSTAALLNGLLNDPFIEDNVTDWPDPFTLVPTFKSTDRVHQSLTIWNGAGGASDGGTGLYVRGDPWHSWGIPSSIATSTGSYAITWAGCSNNMNSSLALGGAGGYANARPIAIGHRLTFSAVGPYHTCVVRVMELPPWGDISSGYNFFPTASNLGPTFTQREWFRAREETLAPGETIQLNLFPMDSASLNFAFAGGTRESGGQHSWSGAIIWIHGLVAGDTIYHDGVVHHSFWIPAGPVFTTSAFQIPKSIVKPDTVAQESVLSKIVDVVAEGWNIFKTVAGVASTVVTAAAPFLAASAAPSLGSMSPEACASAMYRMRRDRNGQLRARVIAIPHSATAVVPTSLSMSLVMPDEGVPADAKEYKSVMSKRVIIKEPMGFVQVEEEKDERRMSVVSTRSSPPTGVMLRR